MRRASSRQLELALSANLSACVFSVTGGEHTSTTSNIETSGGFALEKFQGTEYNFMLEASGFL